LTQQSYTCDLSKHLMERWSLHAGELHLEGRVMQLNLMAEFQQLRTILNDRSRIILLEHTYVPCVLGVVFELV
jgi:hypothetical protein